MKFWKYTLGALALATITAWLAVFATGKDNLHIIACDVGQGDAILITKGSTQILTDGGPDNKVLDCIQKYLPFYDREIELVILTHPQLDHYGGLIEVVRRYKVGTFLQGLSENSSSQRYELLKKEIENRKVRMLFAKEGMVIKSGMIQINILNPTEKVSNYENINDASIVYLLTYGEFDALFTGDIERVVSNRVAQLVASESRNIEYLKVPHHGSKNGLTKDLLDSVDPDIAIISVGKDNRFGHPDEEVMKLLNEINTNVLRTDTIGDIELESDGKSWWLN